MSQSFTLNWIRFCCVYWNVRLRYVGLHRQTTLIFMRSWNISAKQFFQETLCLNFPETFMEFLFMELWRNFQTILDHILTDENSEEI